MLKLLDVYLIQRKTTMQAVRALGYSLARKEGKVFEKISEILGSLLFEGTELGRQMFLSHLSAMEQVSRTLICAPRRTEAVKLLVQW